MLKRTFVLVIGGHIACDLTWFAVGRFTEVGLALIVPTILVVGLGVALLIEGKHR